MDSYGVFAGFHQIMDLRCNEAVLNIAVLSCICAGKGCSVRGKKASAYYESFQSVVWETNTNTPSTERCNVTFGFSRVKVETTELNILLFPVLNGYIEL